MKYSMKKRVTIPLALATITALAVTLSSQPDVPFTGHGDPEALSAVYNRWKSSYESRGGAEVVRIGLNHSKALSKELTTATGQAALNLFDGHLQVAVNMPHYGNVVMKLRSDGNGFMEWACRIDFAR